MHLNTFWLRISRFYTVLSSFIKMFWSFYSVKFKKLWHSRSWPHEHRKKLYVSEARRFRQTAVQLGGMLIKLGQFFSTRVDVFPQAVIRELAGLQDEVQSVPFHEIRQVAEEDFARSLEEVYAQVDEIPLASASLGQVHRGKLTTGETVAIKILRPGIENLIRIDLKAIAIVIKFLKIFTNWDQKIDMDRIFEEFTDTLLNELDYVQEGHNAETIARNTDDKDILFPTIYWDYTTNRVLTMQFMEGFKISDIEAITKAGINRSDLARRLEGAYIKQILIDGFFHADPHPGNIFVTSEGKLVMIDFGMVGTIPLDLREILTELVLAIIRRDNIQVVEFFKILGFLRYDADSELVARAVGFLMEETLGTGVDISQADFGSFLADLENLLYEQPFQIPAQYTFLGRALGTLYGICIVLDPNFNFLDEAKPYLSAFTKEKHLLKNTIKEKAALIGSSLVEIPPLAARVLSRMDNGELSIKFPLVSLENSIAANTRATYNLSAFIVFGLTLFTSAYLYVNQLHTYATVTFSASLIIPLLILRLSRPKNRSTVIIDHSHLLRRQRRNNSK